MKKFYTAAASTLLLALSMTMMTACSSDNDPVIDQLPIVPEQPAVGTRTITLKATADIGAETRVAVEGIDGKDAFNITGWKDGEEVVACYTYEADGEPVAGEVVFTYDATNDVFTGEVPNTVELSAFKYAHTGAIKRAGGSASFMGEFFAVTMDLPSVMTPEETFFCGVVTNEGESLSATLSAPYALACVHNNSDADLNVVPYTVYTYQGNDMPFYFDGGEVQTSNGLAYSTFSYMYVPDMSSSDMAASEFLTDIEDIKQPITIPAGEKAYIPLVSSVSVGGTPLGEVSMGLMNTATGNPIASPKSVTTGKVYKVQYDGEPVEPYVDLGLSVLWATCNLGADKPNQSGLYYQWADTQGWGNDPEKDDKFFDWHNFFDNSSTYKWNDCKVEWYTDYDSGESYSDWIDWLTKYCSDGRNGDTDGRETLEMEDDAARAALGGNWRIPSAEECEELIDNCTWTWTTMGDVNGYKVQSNIDGYTDKWIFIPAAGYRRTRALLFPNSIGSYWTSDMFNDHYSNIIYFKESDYYTDSENRASGLTIRPVLTGTTTE